MAIDWDQMGQTDEDFGRRALAGMLVPVIGQQRIVYAEPEKPKRKQQGRGENQLEQDFAWHLGKAKAAGLIADSWVKPFVLTIGPDMTFEPDFMVRDWAMDLWVIDTKGPFSREDSRIKIKVAAEKFPIWRWLIVTRPDGQWKAREVTEEKGISRRYTNLPWLK